MKNGHSFEYKSIPANMLKVDKLYQRDISNARIARICSDFNPDLVNEPKVSQRPDGSYYVFNGQHTAVSIRKLFGQNTNINCKVFHGLTWEEEKELFVKQNGIAKDPTTSEKLRAEYNSKNKDVVAMVEAANDANVKVDFGVGQATYKVIAVSALFSAYKRLGKEKLTDLLDIISKAWNGEPLSYSSGFIGGLTLLYLDHMQEMTKEKLIKALSSHTPEFYAREARDMNGTVSSRYYKLFVRVYNKGKSTNKIQQKE